jgi:hypothetical protein
MESLDTYTSRNTSNTTKHCHEVTHQEYYEYSAILVCTALVYCLWRCVKWWNLRKVARLPLLVSTALVISLSLRAIWCILRYTYWNRMNSLNGQVMYSLNRLPLLLQLSAFSAISLSWIANATTNYTCFRISILSANFLLYTMSLVAVIIESVQSSEDQTYAHKTYHIITLFIIAGSCLCLSILFTVFGIRLRMKLYGSIHVSSKILRSFNRIFYATCLCSISFGLRAIIFGFTTVQYNLLGICEKWNYIIYPLIVYAIPSVTTSIAILFIMDVDSEDVSDNEEQDNYNNSRRRKKNSNKRGRTNDYGSVGEVKVDDYDQL